MKARHCLAALSVSLVLLGCTAPAPGTPGSAAVSRAVASAAATTSSAAASTSSRTLTTSRPAPPALDPAVARARTIYATMTPAQRVGQLFMTGCDAAGDCANLLADVTAGDLGGVILTGRSYGGSSVIVATTTRLQSLARTGERPGLFVAADQEGGTVQALQGPGFDRIPSALEQGTSSPAAAGAGAQRWGAQLKRAGVNLDLAPVLDTVPGPAFAAENPPIGQLDRELGYDPVRVTAIGTAVVTGLLRAGVGTTVKHFPGLGRVRANTDDSAGVTDTVTTASDPYLAPFRAAIAAGTPFVMMSTAVYTRIDASLPAAFSPAVVTTLLRGKLGFGGVVISDDLGAAVQVSAWTPAQRAVLFLAAGGDMVLTVDATQLAAMQAAALARAAADPRFAAQTAAAAVRVLAAKVRAGLA